MFYKLPNKKIVRVDQRGFATFEIEMPLKAFIEGDHEIIMDGMSLLATGDVLMTDVTYEVTRNVRNTLVIALTGNLNNLGLEIIDEADISSQEWTVEITRTAYGSESITVTAKTQEEAIEIADQKAGDILFSDKVSEYSFSVASVN